MKKNIIIFICVSSILFLLMVVIIVLLIFALKNNTIFDIGESSSEPSSMVSKTESEVSVSSSSITIFTPSKVESTNTSPSSTPSPSEPIISESSTVESSSLSPLVNQEVIDNTERIWFQQLYSLAEAQYKMEIDNKIYKYSNELSQWEEKSREYSSQRYIEENNLRESYANMGLLNSGAYQSAISNLNSKYQRLQSECSSNISRLSSEISTLNQEKNNPDSNQILAIIASNNNMTAAQVIEYYNKYMQ